MIPVLNRMLASIMAVRGIAAMVLAMGLFITNDTLLKLTVQELPIGEAMAMRSFLSALLILAVIVHAGHARVLFHAFRPRVFSRSMLDSLTSVSYVAALAVMPIAATTTIYLAAPLITTALAVPLLGEKVSWKGWCAVLVGFAGAVVVMRPDPASFSIMALLPLLAAALGSMRDITTRGIGMEIPGTVVTFSAAITLTLTGIGMGAWEEWQMPSASTLAYIVGAAFTFASGTLALVYAFRNAPVVAVSPLRYLLVFGALVSGFFVFGETLDQWTAVGMTLVVSSGLYAIQSERLRSREERRQGADALVEGGAAGGALGGALGGAPGVTLGHTLTQAAVAQPPKD
ncbi:DMT family transporter [Xanthobacter sp. TB0139]|uniref:DMT family transporter n=1 Tax=Xanthobacter sp. TB0139 TaxID=3459178 RepID=UPI0040396A3B